MCRFDDFDGAAPAPDNTIVHFRALHAIPKGGFMVTTCDRCPMNVGRSDSMAVGSPATAYVVWAGEELTQSYFPITWSYEERQATSTSQYGFACSCPRCQVLLCVRATVNPQMWSIRSLIEVASALC